MNKLMITLICILSLSGCAAAPGLYAEIGAGVLFNSSLVEDPSCHTAVLYDSQGELLRGGGHRSCGGDNPQATMSIGWEFRNDMKVEWLHDSNYFDGGSDRETYTDQFRVVKKFGGRE